jgi:hypothetical protein
VSSFLIIAKNTGLRKVFMKTNTLHLLLRHAFMICSEKDVSDRTRSVKEDTIKLLCVLSTVKTNRFYIPGETNMIERLRKDAMDKGLYATLTQMYRVLD